MVVQTVKTKKFDGSGQRTTGGKNSCRWGHETVNPTPLPQRQKVKVEKKNRMSIYNSHFLRKKYNENFLPHTRLRRTIVSAYYSKTNKILLGTKKIPLYYSSNM